MARLQPRATIARHRPWARRAPCSRECPWRRRMVGHKVMRPPAHRRVLDCWSLTRGVCVTCASTKQTQTGSMRVAARSPCLGSPRTDAFQVRVPCRLVVRPPCASHTSNRTFPRRTLAQPATASPSRPVATGRPRDKRGEPHTETSAYFGKLMAVHLRIYCALADDRPTVTEPFISAS